MPLLFPPGQEEQALDKCDPGSGKRAIRVRQVRHRLGRWPKNYWYMPHVTTGEVSCRTMHNKQGNGHAQKTRQRRENRKGDGRSVCAFGCSAARRVIVNDSLAVVYYWTVHGGNSCSACPQAPHHVVLKELPRKGMSRENPVEKGPYRGGVGGQPTGYVN